MISVYPIYSLLFDNCKELINKIQEKSEALNKNEIDFQCFIMEVESRTIVSKI